MGRGRGAGRGMQFGRQPGSMAAQDQKTVLEEQASFLERQLDRIKRQVSGLGGGKQEPQ